jgi:hypothetical protein
VYVFYFDVIGFVERFLSEGQEALTNLRAFQRKARAAFEFSRPNSFVVTLYDNVWSRINASQPGTPSLVLDFAGTVMSAAIEHGFSTYFGAITRGIHDYDPSDRMLVAKNDWEDLTEQHLDITSEPHVRAALAEKWSKRGTGTPNSVWVSSEVVNGGSLTGLSSFPTSAFEPVGGWFELTALDNGRRWPFAEARFHAIGPKILAQ